MRDEFESGHVSPAAMHSHASREDANIVMVTEWMSARLGSPTPHAAGPVNMEVHGNQLSSHMNFNWSALADPPTVPQLELDWRELFGGATPRDG